MAIFHCMQLKIHLINLLRLSVLRLQSCRENPQYDTFYNSKRLQLFNGTTRYIILVLTWYHLTRSSGSGFVKKPPTSAPTNGRPATLTERSMGIEIFRWLHSALLSPVQIAPVRVYGVCEALLAYSLARVSAN